MNTIRTIADDIIVDLNQTFDDKDIQLSQIVYWVMVIGNKLKTLHIAKRSSGAFLTTFTDIAVNIYASNTNPNKVEYRKYFILPKTIYDFHNDRGIDYIAYTSNGQEGCPPRFTTVTFLRTTPKTSARLYYNEYEKPSPQNPYFYRTGDHIYLLGIEKVNVDFLEIGLFMSFDPITSIDIDEPFDFPEETLHQLKREVLDLGRFALLVPKERINEGDDKTAEGQVPKQRLVSIQPQQLQQQ